MSSDPISLQPTLPAPAATAQSGAGVTTTNNLKSAFFMSWPVYASLGLNGLVTALGGPLTTSYNPQELALAAFLCGKVNPATTDVFTSWEVAEQILAIGSAGQVTPLSTYAAAPDHAKAANTNSPTNTAPDCPAAPDHANTADHLTADTPDSTPFTAVSITSTPAEPDPTDPVSTESSYRLFRQYLREYLRSVELSQEQLARLLYTDPKMLSRRLNLSQGAFLTLPEARRLILKLAELEALTYQWQALELLQILYPTQDFSRDEWRTAPLNRLDSPRFRAKAVRPSAAPTTGFTTIPSEKEGTLEENFAVANPATPDHEPAPALVQEPSPLANSATPAALVTATDQPTASTLADHANNAVNPAPADHAILTATDPTLTNPPYQESPKPLTPDELKREKARTLARQELEAGFPASFLTTPFTLGLSSTDKILIEAMCQGESNDTLCKKFGLARATLANKFITPFYIRLGVTGTLTGSDYRRQLVVIKAYREGLIEPPAPADRLELSGLELTEIELELIRLVAVMGLKRSHLEVMYDLPFYTLDRHFKRLYNRLGVDGPYELTCYAYRHGLVDQLPPPPALTLAELLARPEPKPKAQTPKEQATPASVAVTPAATPTPATASAVAVAPACRRQSKPKPPTPRAATTATATPQPPASRRPLPDPEKLEAATSPQVEKTPTTAAPALSKDQKALVQARQELEEGWPGSYLAAPVVATLTRQEQTFLEGLCLGEANAALVRRLKINKTALTKKVIAPLYIKLGLHRSYATLESRRQLAVIKAYRLGLVSPNPGERLELTALGLSRLDIELIRLSAVEGLRRSHIAVKFSQPLYLVDEMLQKLYLKLRVNGSGGLAAYVYRHGLAGQLPPVEGRELDGNESGETQNSTPLPLPGPTADHAKATIGAGDDTGGKAALVMLEPASASPDPDHATQNETTTTTTAAVTTNPTMLEGAAEDTKAEEPVSNADWEEYHQIARQAARYYYWVVGGNREELEQIAAVAAAYAYNELAGSSCAPTRREIANTAASEIRRQIKNASPKRLRRVRLDQGGALGLRESEETSPRYASRWVDTEHSFSDLSLGQKLRWGLEEYLDEAS